jgi:hypothetical protein
MRKLHIFLIVLTITLSVLLTLALIGWYLAATSPSYYESSWMSQMWGSHLGGSSNYGMGGMMGSGEGVTSSYLWIIPVALGAILIVALVGVAFYLSFPELRYIKGSSCSTIKSEPDKSQHKDTMSKISGSPVLNNCDVLLKTMTPEEQKVLNVLVTHQGKYLQKYVGKETGLSRLKTHRIIARFAQRGIVTVKEFGNTNEILVSDWVKDSK